MKKLIFALLLFTSCKVQKQYIFKPGDIVKVKKTRFLILDYNKNRKGFFYKAKDLNRDLLVEYFSQAKLENVKPVAQQKYIVKTKK